MAKKTAGRKGAATKVATKRAAASGRKTAGKTSAPAKRKSAAKRTLVDTGVDKRYVRRNPKGEFKESDDVGRSLSADRRKKAKTRVKSGQGDRGDR